MKVTKKDVLAVLIVFALLVLATDLWKRVASAPAVPKPHPIKEAVLRSLADGNSEIAKALGLVKGRVAAYPIGKKDGLEAGRARLARLKAGFATAEALFPVFSRNYLVEFFVDTDADVSGRKENGKGVSRSTVNPRLSSPSPLDGSERASPSRRSPKGDGIRSRPGSTCSSTFPSAGASRPTLPGAS